MKKLLLLSAVLAVAAASASASELKYLPGGQPACTSEEVPGCEIGHKVADATQAASPQADCFQSEMAVVATATKAPKNDIIAMIVAGMCKTPSAAVTSCVNQALKGARDAGAPISSDAGLDAVVKMCSASK